MQTTTNNRINPYNLTDASIADIMQSYSDYLGGKSEAVDALAEMALEDYTRKRYEMGLDGDPAPVLQFRAIARYAFLFGYALALQNIKGGLDEANGVMPEGHFPLRVDSEGMAPAFQLGDVLEIKPAPFTEERQTGTSVIRKDGGFIMGQALMEKDGTGTLYSGATVTPFTPEEFVGYAVAVRRSLATPEAKQ